jgi:hypothetical protein
LRLYAMWLRWSRLSRCFPSQQSGKLMCNSRCSGAFVRRDRSGTDGHVGHALKNPFFGLTGTSAQLRGGLTSGADLNISDEAQAQYTTFVLCGRLACASPATTLSPAGNACIWS